MYDRIFCLLTNLFNKFGITSRDAGRCRSASGVGEIEAILGYRFEKPSLCLNALIHRSHPSCKNHGDYSASNERLEFLGDAVLDCCVAHYLFERYPSKTEGTLSKIKSLVVSRKILAQIAEGLGLGPYICMGVSEEETGGRKKVSILANTFEAIIGAMYLDAGIEPVDRFLERSLYSRIEGFLKETENINYKSKLMERSQKSGFGIPIYQLIRTQGPEHKKIFTMSVWINKQKVGEGTGMNKKEAEQKAAKQALQQKGLFRNHDSLS